MYLQHCFPTNSSKPLTRSGRCWCPPAVSSITAPTWRSGWIPCWSRNSCAAWQPASSASSRLPSGMGPTGYAVTGPDQGTLDVSTERFGRHVKDVLSSFWEIRFGWIVICVHHQQMDGPEALAIRQAAAEVIFEKTHAERGDAWWGKAPCRAGTTSSSASRSGPPSCRPPRSRASSWPITPFLRDRAAYGRPPRSGGPGPPGYGGALVLHHARRQRRWPGQESAPGQRRDGERMWTAMVDAWVEQLSALRRPNAPPPKM